MFNLSLTNTWIQDCDHNHGDKYHSAQYPWATLDTVQLVLIDVERCCLARPLEPYKYLALSSTWDATENPFQTTTQNLWKLIQDSMSITRLAGVRYLWVDRFCTVQDDPADKVRQLPAMASIYANACFTIVTTDGTEVDVGLPGVSWLGRFALSVRGRADLHWQDGSQGLEMVWYIYTKSIILVPSKLYRRSLY